MVDHANQPSTLTKRVAAIQIKMWHLAYRMKKIHRDQKSLRKKKYRSLRAKIVRNIPTFYNVIDMIIAMEHLSVLMKEIKATIEIGKRLDHDMLKSIGSIQDRTARWIAVRHKIGGHLDLEMVEATCEYHNFYGALLSNDLEADIGIYNVLILEGAINAARLKSDIFGRDLDCRNDLPGEMEVIVDKLNEDWNAAFETFAPLIEAIYELGKEEKFADIGPNAKIGLIDFSQP